MKIDYSRIFTIFVRLCNFTVKARLKKTKRERAKERERGREGEREREREKV